MPTISTLLLLRETLFLTGGSDLPVGTGPAPLLPVLALLAVRGMEDAAVRRGRGPLLLLLLLPLLSLLRLLAAWTTECRKVGASCCSRTRVGMLCCEWRVFARAGMLSWEKGGGGEAW